MKIVDDRPKQNENKDFEVGDVLALNDSDNTIAMIVRNDGRELELVPLDTADTDDVDVYSTEVYEGFWEDLEAHYPHARKVKATLHIEGD